MPFTLICDDSDRRVTVATDVAGGLPAAPGLGRNGLAATTAAPATATTSAVTAAAPMVRGLTIDRKPSSAAVSGADADRSAHPGLPLAGLHGRLGLRRAVIELARVEGARAVGVGEVGEAVGAHAGRQLDQLGDARRRCDRRLRQEGPARLVRRLVPGVVPVEVAPRASAELEAASLPARVGLRVGEVRDAVAAHACRVLLQLLQAGARRGPGRVVGAAAGGRQEGDTGERAEGRSYDCGKCHAQLVWDRS